MSTAKSAERTTLGHRITSGVLAAAMGLSCVATNMMGIADMAELNIHAAPEEPSGQVYDTEIRTSYRGNYEVGKTYYDIGMLYGHAYHDGTAWTDVGNGNYQEQGWQIYNVKSFLDSNEDGYYDTDTDMMANTLPYTTDLNRNTDDVSEKELMCWQVYATQEAYRNKYLERSDIPDFNIPTFEGDATPAFYIAEGVVTQEGEDRVITWEIRSWVSDNSTWINPDTFADTSLTGLASGIAGADLEGYFNGLGTGADDEVMAMWEKANFEDSAGVSEPLTFGSTIDTWWKGVAANIYKADTTIDASDEYQAGSGWITTAAYHADNVVDILGNNPGWELDASSVSRSDIDTDSKLNLGNVITHSPVNEMILTGETNPASIGVDQGFGSVGTITANTFDGRGTYATYVDPSAISIDISRAALVEYANQLTEFAGFKTGTDDVFFLKEANDDHRVHIGMKGAVMVAVEAAINADTEIKVPERPVNFITEDASTYDADKEYRLSDAEAAIFAKYVLKQYADGKYEGATKDNWIFNDDTAQIQSRISSQGTTINDTNVLAAIQQNLLDVDYSVVYDYDAAMFTFQFANLAPTDNNYNRSWGHAVFPLVSWISNLVNLGSAAKADLTSYFSTGYQRAAGTVKAKRAVNDTLDTFAKTDDANNSTPTIGVASNNATIVDRVDYNGLTPGVEYKVVGALYDVTTGHAIKADGTVSESTDVITFNPDAEYAVASEVFTPEHAVDSINLTFNYDASALAGHTIVVLERLYLTVNQAMVAEHVDKEDADQQVSIGTPDMGTVATNKADGKKVLDVTSAAVITDTVNYENLVPGVTYTLIAQAVNKADGSEIEGATATKTFVPEKANGSVTIDVTVNTEKLVGKSIVMFETVKQGETELLVHANIDDAQQTVSVKTPSITTVAKSESGTKQIDVMNDAVIIDTVSYENLVAGQEYKLKAELFDAETEQLQQIDSQVVTFTAEAASGSVNVNIKFDTREHAGKSFVVVEYLTYGKTEIARHYDLTDDDQTVTVKTPSIRTFASSSDEAVKTIDCDAAAVILDKVTYENLAIGQEYTLTASLYDATTSTWTNDVATATFTADATGVATVNITFDTSDLKGHTLVVGEVLSIDGIAIVTHKEIDDEDQTVSVSTPDIITRARGNDGTQIVDCTDDLTITDTVDYRNLVVGQTYTLTAGLYDVTADEWIGTSVGTKTFTAETEDGSVDVVITGVDTLARQGHKIVVVETLKSGSTTIVTHDSKTDEEQTVTVKKPSIKTVAASVSGDKEIDCDGSVSIVDTVTYTGLTVGKEYTMTAGLWDVTANKWINETAETVTFTPTSANGSVDVTITGINTNELAGHKLVVVETLKYDETVITEHTDKKDTDQTVTVKTPSIRTNAYNATKTSQRIDCLDKVTIVDTVAYEGLTVGKTYTLTAGLYDTTVGEWLNESAAEQTFKPTAANGSVDVVIADVDTTALVGHSIVVVETLKSGSVTYVNHDDLTDVDQTVTVKGPSIQTIAMNFDKSEKEIGVSKTAVIVDTVEFTDLSIGTTYTLEVGLYDVTAGDYVAITLGEGSDTFTATSETGTHDVTITVDTTELAGHKLVVVETLKVEETVVTEHTNFEDENQTVTVKTPTIRTNAYAADKTSQIVDCGKDVTIVDTVTYENLETTKSYTLVAGLWDATANQWLTETAGTKTFTPATVNGSVDVVLEHVDTTAYAGHKIVVFEQLTVDETVIVNHSDASDADQTVTVKTPRIATVASDKVSGNKILDCSENAVIVDVVNYTGLTVGTEYTLVAKVYDKSAGTLISGVTANKTFTPTTEDGSVSIEIPVDTSDMPSSMLVVFESLYEGETLITTHEDETDEDQTVTVAYPGIRTTATVDDVHVTNRSEDVVINDVVTYTGLTPGKSYTLTAELRDKTTGEVVSSTSTPVTFTAETASGSQTVQIHFNAIENADVAAVVVYEYLTSGEETITVHTDLTDTDQTVNFVTPSIKTVATNATGDSHNIDCYKQAVVLDTITYTGLTAGTEYTLKSVIYDVTDFESERVAVANKTSTFTAETADGTTAVNINVDTTALKGHTLVVSEVITLDDTDVLVHDDMTDADQTVYVDVPRIRTTATSVTTGTHTLERNATAQVVDRVTYTGLVPGQKYTVTATPYDKATGKALTGVEPVTVEFTAEATDGYVDVTVTIDTSLLAGKSIVMFEKLKQDTVEIAVHEDLTDEQQTVVVPTIDTVAATAGGSHTLKINEDVTVTDTITFTGLTVGETYSVTGQLVYKTDSSKSVAESSAEFTPTEANGTVTVEYVFNTSGHANESFVCFETIKSSNGTVIIDHKDINDADQTVTVEDTPTTTDTGDHSKMVFHFTLSALFGIAFIAYVTVIFRRRRAE